MSLIAGTLAGGGRSGALGKTGWVKGLNFNSGRLAGGVVISGSCSRLMMSFFTSNTGTAMSASMVEVASKTKDSRIVSAGWKRLLAGREC